MSWMDCGCHTDSGAPQGLTKVQAVTPGPRFGFAYDPFGNGKTAVRGGFGIAVLPQTQINTSLQSQPPYSYRPQAYYGTLNTFLNAAGSIFPSNVQGTDWSQLVQMYSFSLGVQRDVGFATVVDVAFVGNLGRHTLQTQNLNTLPYGKRFLASSQDATNPGKPLPDSFLVPYVGLGSITYGEPVGTSNYYSLQTQANRRFSHGLEFKTNFTWSKSMDYSSNDMGFCRCMRAAGCSRTTCRASIAPSSPTWPGCTKFRSVNTATRSSKRYWEIGMCRGPSPSPAAPRRAWASPPQPVST